METAITAPVRGQWSTACRRLERRRHRRRRAGRRASIPPAATARSAPRAPPATKLGAGARRDQRPAGHRPPAARARLRRTPASSGSAAAASSPAASASTCCSTPGRSARSAALAGFASYDDEGHVADFTPANHVGGWGTIDGRTAVVCADDFTSRGGHADGAIGAKSGYLDRLSMRAARARRSGCWTARRAAAAWRRWCPQQKKEGESAAQESSGAIKAGRPRVAGGGGSFLPGPPRQHACTPSSCPPCRW